MVSPTYHIIAPVLCSGNTFELAERNSMPSDGAEELLKALHKWDIRRRVCQLQQCNGRLSSKEIKGVVSEIQACWEHMHLRHILNCAWMKNKGPMQRLSLQLVSFSIVSGAAVYSGTFESRLSGLHSHGDYELLFLAFTAALLKRVIVQTSACSRETSALHIREEHPQGLKGKRRFHHDSWATLCFAGKRCTVPGTSRVVSCSIELGSHARAFMHDNYHLSNQLQNPFFLLLVSDKCELIRLRSASDEKTQRVQRGFQVATSIHMNSDLRGGFKVAVSR